MRHLNTCPSRRRSQLRSAGQLGALRVALHSRVGWGQRQIHSQKPLEEQRPPLQCTLDLTCFPPLHSPSPSPALSSPLLCPKPHRGQLRPRPYWDSRLRHEPQELGQGQRQEGTGLRWWTAAKEGFLGAKWDLWQGRSTSTEPGEVSRRAQPDKSIPRDSSGGFCLTQGSPSMDTVAWTLLGCAGAVLFTAVSLDPTHEMPGAPSQPRQPKRSPDIARCPLGAEWAQMRTTGLIRDDSRNTPMGDWKAIH